ncbi:MAG: sigma factor, partial [Planctomycetota bacterium]
MDTSPESDFRRFRERGDAAALARVFDALAPKLLLVAQHLTRDAGAAEDLVQTTFLAALRDARGYDERRPLVGWLAGILAHRAQDERRRASVRATEPLGEELCAADDPRAASAELETLERRRLDGRARAAFARARARDHALGHPPGRRQHP